MDSYEIFKVSGAVLLSTGGAGAIIFGLSSWLGKVWASRVLEKERQAYAVELEGFRSQLNAAAEKQQLVFAMYFEGQFKIYNDLWVSLTELQMGVEHLWEEASPSYLEQFVSALSGAKKKIRSSALLIDPVHYEEIMGVIESLEGYQFGKERLIGVRASLEGVEPSEVQELIAQNAENRDRINTFIENMRHSMRRQMSHAP